MQNKLTGKRVQQMLMLGASLGLMTACETPLGYETEPAAQAEAPMEKAEEQMAASCSVLKNQPAGFGDKVDFDINKTIIGVIGVAGDGKGGTAFEQKFAVLDGNASQRNINMAIKELSGERSAMVGYKGERLIDASDTLEVDLDDINGQRVTGSVKTVLSFAPSNWQFATARGGLSFKDKGNPNDGGIAEFYQLSDCNGSGRTISMLNRNATKARYMFNYEVSVSGEQQLTIDPGANNNGTGPGIP